MMAAERIEKIYRRRLGEVLNERSLRYKRSVGYVAMRYLPPSPGYLEARITGLLLPTKRITGPMIAEIHRQQFAGLHQCDVTLCRAYSIKLPGEEGSEIRINFGKNLPRDNSTNLNYVLGNLLSPIIDRQGYDVLQGNVPSGVEETLQAMREPGNLRQHVFQDDRLRDVFDERFRR